MNIGQYFNLLRGICTILLQTTYTLRITYTLSQSAHDFQALHRFQSGVPALAVLGYP